jgi:hypothetical protein
MELQLRTRPVDALCTSTGSGAMRIGVSQWPPLSINASSNSTAMAAAASVGTATVDKPGRDSRAS